MLSMQWKLHLEEISQKSVNSRDWRCSVMQKEGETPHGNGFSQFVCGQFKIEPYNNKNTILDNTRCVDCGEYHVVGVGEHVYVPHFRFPWLQRARAPWFPWFSMIALFKIIYESLVSFFQIWRQLNEKKILIDLRLYWIEIWCSSSVIQFLEIRCIYRFW